MIRQAGNIVIEYRRTRSAQKSMYYEGVKIYIALPTEVKSCERIEQYTGAPIVGIARWSVPRIGQGHLEVKW